MPLHSSRPAKLNGWLGTERKKEEAEKAYSSHSTGAQLNNIFFFHISIAFVSKLGIFSDFLDRNGAGGAGNV